MLVPPAVSKTGQTTRQRLRNTYWRILASVGLALLFVGCVICLLRLDPPVRSDTKPVESTVEPASNRNNDDYVKLLRPIIERTEP